MAGAPICSRESSFGLSCCKQYPTPAAIGGAAAVVDALRGAAKRQTQDILIVFVTATNRFEPGNTKAQPLTQPDEAPGLAPAAAATDGTAFDSAGIAGSCSTGMIPTEPSSAGAWVLSYLHKCTMQQRRDDELASASAGSDIIAAPSTGNGIAAPGDVAQVTRLAASGCAAHQYECELDSARHTWRDALLAQFQLVRARLLEETHWLTENGKIALGLVKLPRFAPAPGSTRSWY